MKRLNVPFLPVLDVLDVTSIEPILETRSQREYITCANWEAYPYKPIAAFNIARTDTNLYLRFSVMGNSLKASFEEDGSPVYQDSCVEFFMRKEGERRYRNFEFNCIGTCDAAVRLSRDEASPLTREEMRRIIRYPSIKREAFGERKGIHAWSLIVVIPFELMGIDPDHLPEKIYGNFYKCADNTENPHFLSWSPIDLPEPNFHCPEFFGEIYL